MNRAFHIAVCSAALTASREIQLLPAGRFRPSDGRRVPPGGWHIDAALAARIIARAAQRTNPFVIDYEHQTIHAERNGQPAPAAGWFTKLEWREGDGLYATDVTWTARARQMIEAGEYKFISPVFAYDKQTGDVVAILMAAITNDPALDGMDDVALRAAARFSLEQETEMDLLKKLLAALGLEEGKTEDETVAAATALKKSAEQAADLATQVKTANDAVAAAKAEVTAAKAAAPDPAKYVPIETMTALQTQVATLTAQVQTSDLDKTVRGALTAGKLLPAQEAWARSLGEKDMAALKAYLDTAPPIAALKGQQSAGKEPQKKTPANLEPEQLAVCKALNIAPEEYAKTLAADQDAQAAA